MTADNLWPSWPEVPQPDNLYLMDGIGGLRSLPQHSVDMLLTDPPLGDVPRVELFARQTAPGWHVWGNEVESSIDFWPSWPEVERGKNPCPM